MGRLYLLYFGQKILNRACQNQATFIFRRKFNTSKTKQLSSKTSPDPIFFESAGLRLQLRIDFFKGVHVDLAALPTETSSEQTFKFFKGKLLVFNCAFDFMLLAFFIYLSILKNSILLLALEQQCREKKQSVVWVRVPIELSSVAASIGDLGFIYHHAIGRHSVLYKVASLFKCFFYTVLHNKYISNEL